MFFVSYYDSIIGKLRLISTSTHLLRLDFSSQNENFNIENSDDLIVIKKIKSWLNLYFSGQNPTINQDLLQIEGTIFQKKFGC